MTRLTSLTVKSLVTLLIAGGMFATNVHAQSDDTVTIRIPFPFTAGTETVAPGTYQFRLLSTHFILAMHNVKTGDMEMFDVRPEEQRAADQNARLVFRNSEGTSVLDEVHFPGSNSFSQVVERRGSGRMVAKKSATDGSISVVQR